MPQLKRPQDTPEEKTEDKKAKKKVKGPRALGLLQLNSSSNKGTLIPIAILVDGKFYDASVYKADPVPMALESGTVYEVEQAGSSQGLFTINGTLHSTTTEGSAHPWTGSGSYLPNGTSVAKSTRKAEDVPVGLDNTDSDAPPRLTRGKAAKPADADGSNPPPASGAPAGSGSTEKPAASAPPASSQPASAPSGGGSSDKDSPKAASPPASEKPAAQDPKAQSPIPSAPGKVSPAKESPSQASAGKKSEDEYRPTLRRGKPTPQEDGKPEPETTTFSNSIQFVPAISDGGGPDPRSYKFYWKTGEEEERRNQMLALAGDEKSAAIKCWRLRGMKFGLTRKHWPEISFRPSRPP